MPVRYSFIVECTVLNNGGDPRPPTWFDIRQRILKRLQKENLLDLIEVKEAPKSLEERVSKEEAALERLLADHDY